MSTEKVVIGALAGLAAGALLGVLFAPNKGSETRKKISKKSADALNDLKEKFDELMDNLADKFKDIQEEKNELFEKGKKKGEEIKKDVKNAMN